MPLNLIGKLHRTVYISNCPENAEEDFVLLLMKKCGAIEAWDVSEDGKRITVIFQSINSMSNALLLNGIAFLGETHKIVLWKATEKPPLEAASQLTITASNSDKSATSFKRRRKIDKVNDDERSVDNSKGVHHSNDNNDNNNNDVNVIEDEKEKEEVRIRRVSDRAERRAALHNTLQTSTQVESTEKRDGNDHAITTTTTTINWNNNAMDEESAYHNKMKELCYRQLKALCALTANSINNVQQQIAELRKIALEQQQQQELQVQQTESV